MGAYFLALFSDDAAMARERVIAAMQSAGADSPRSARTVVELDVVTDDVWDYLIREGTVREGPPDHFYLFGIKRASRRERLIKMVFFWALILLIPVVLILATGRAGHNQ
jgi:hypothetical protein